MYDLLSLLSGVIIAVMVALNGGLTARYGVYGAAVIIHIVGSLFALLLVMVRRRSISVPRGIPWWLFLGGVIGVLTTAFNNFAYGKISLTSIVALGLLGQTAASLFIDSFGLFGMRRYPFQNSTLIGLFFSAAGIYVMLDHSAQSALYAVALSFSGGVTVVLSRTVNARLSQHIGALSGSLINHLVGLPVTVAVFFLFGRRDPVFSHIPVSSNAWIYLGGVLGVMTVLLFNIIVPRTPAFRLTLLSFLGQISTGIALDLITKQGYTGSTFAGGLLVAAGISANVICGRIRCRRLQKAPSCRETVLEESRIPEL